MYDDGELMSKICSVVHSCGHEADYFFVSDGAARNETVDLFEKSLCTECQEKKSRIFASAKNLPPLKGTPAQVSSAGRIRADAMQSKDNQTPIMMTDEDVIEQMKEAGFIAEVDGVPTDRAVQHYWKLINSVREAKQELRTETDASWWLDNRSRINQHVLNAYRSSLSWFKHAIKSNKDATWDEEQ
jgi:hypothetical protein